jgi:hypothetical protein
LLAVRVDVGEVTVPATIQTDERYVARSA